MSLKKPSACLGCPLSSISRGFIEPSGSGALGVLIVGEAGGENEAAEGRPFVESAQAGSMLESIIRRCGYDREQFTITNLCLCQPPGNILEGAKYEYGAVAHCRQAYFMKLIERFRPKVIWALGGVPLKHLTGFGVGEKRTIKDVRGYFLPDILGLGIPVIGSYHPSYIRRGETRLIPLLMMDLQKAVMLATGQLKEGYDYILNPIGHSSLSRYEEHPTLDRARQFLEFVRARPHLPIAFDIENPKVREDEQKRIQVDQPITQIQFSVEPWTGLAFPWADGYKEVAAEILKLPNIKVGHNSFYYDQLVLARNGVKVEGEHQDTMFIAQALYSDLPKGLQSVSSWLQQAPWLAASPWKAGAMPFAWKHMTGQAFEMYGIADVDAALRLYLSLMPELDRRGHLESYREQFYERMRIMAKTTERGITVDRVAQDNLRKDLQEEIDDLNAKIQGHVPDELRRAGNAGGKAKKDGYKKVPKEVQEILDRGEQPGNGWVQREFPNIVAHKCEPCQGKKGNKECAECGGKGKIEKQEGVAVRWTKLTEFNGGSSDQVKAYIRWRKHPMPQHLKTKKDSTGKDGLADLFKKTGDPVYGYLLRLRMVDKMKDSFTGHLWVPGEDGKVHPTFQPLTGSHQWIARAPNSTQMPNHNKIAKSFKRTIVASEGCLFVEFDHSGFHTITQSFEASDPDYMRLARLDMHSYITGHKLCLPGVGEWLEKPDSELKSILDRVKEEHEDERSRTKSMVFGRQFGQLVPAFYNKHKANYDPSDEEAREWIGTNWHYQVYDPLTRRRVALRSHPEDRRMPLAKMVIGKSRVQALFDLTDGLFPKVYKDYPVAVMNEAYRLGYLDSLFGMRRYFLDVYTWNHKKQCLEPGMDADKIKAYRPSNDAHAMMGQEQLEMERLGYLEKYRFCNFVHDAVYFDCPKSLVYECLVNISTVMQSPNKVLVSPMVPDGLVCAVDAKVGPNLAQMKKVNLGRLYEWERKKANETNKV